MDFCELQLSITNSCQFNCKYCYKDKNKPKFLNEDTLDRIIKLAKDNNIEAIRFTGGDIFEHERIEDFLKKVKENGLKTIVNITSYRIEHLEDIIDECDYVLISFENLDVLKNRKEKVKKFTTTRTNTIFMGCMVFQEDTKNISKILEEASEIRFFSFFFLRNIREKSKKYFDKLNKLSKKISNYEQDTNSNTEMKIANAFPLCYVPFNSIKNCSGKKFDDGETRFFIDEEGNIKLNSYSSKKLGNVLDLDSEEVIKKVKGEKNRLKNKFLKEDELCNKCKIKKYCGGGIFSKSEISKDYFSKFRGELLTRRDNFSPLQKKLINFLPESNFEGDYKKIYFRNSDFLYPSLDKCDGTISFKKFNNKISKEGGNWGLNLRFPFCEKKSKFCKVNDYSKEYMNKGVEFMLKQIEKFSSTLENKNIKYLHINGGYPSKIGLENLKKIFEKLFKYLDKSSLEEITLELFPKKFNKKLFDYLSNIVTRVSIKIGCFNDKILEKFNIDLRVKEMEKFIRKMNEYDFNINLDIFYSLYIDNEKDYEEEMDKILSFNPDNITFRPLHNKKISNCDEIFFHKYSKILERLNRKGRKILNENEYIQYTAEDFYKENKNKFLYKLNSLKKGNILGLGQDSFSYFGDNYYIYENPNKWSIYKLKGKEKLLQEISLKSRLLSLDINKINKKYCIDYEFLFSDSINYLTGNGLINIDDGVIKITEKGLGYVDFISNLLMLNNFEYKLK
ncbi:MAG: radical SAM protein [Candidatus Woesearchaeota archaeon]